jgi:hypothetical protein
MKKLLLIFFLLICANVYGADAEIRGETASGTFVYLSVENDGKLNINLPSAFTDGSSNVSAKVDADNSLYVNLKTDSRPRAQKTTTNTTASTIAQTVTPIANQKTITIALNQLDKEVWVKVGDVDAGIDSGSLVWSSIIITDCATDTVISYYASESVKISIIQE